MSKYTQVQTFHCGHCGTALETSLAEWVDSATLQISLLPCTSEDCMRAVTNRAELIEALRDNLIVLLSNYQAIESLPFEALGVVHPTHEHNGYPIRDEVLHDIAGAIKNTKAAIAKATGA